MRAEPSLEQEPDGGGRRGRGRPPSPGIDRRILDAALELLASGGYAGFRLDALAKRAGVAKTTILRRWPSKAAVAAAAVEQLALQTIDVPASDTLRGDLHALLTSAVAVFTNGHGAFVPRLIRESGHHPVIADLLADGAFREERWDFPFGADRPVYFFDLPADLIWGATARILHELLSLVVTERTGPPPPAR